MRLPPRSSSCSVVLVGCTIFMLALLHKADGATITPQRRQLHPNASGYIPVYIQHGEDPPSFQTHYWKSAPFKLQKHKRPFKPNEIKSNHAPIHRLDDKNQNKISHRLNIQHPSEKMSMRYKHSIPVVHKTTHSSGKKEKHHHVEAPKALHVHRERVKMDAHRAKPKKFVVL